MEIPWGGVGWGLLLCSKIGNSGKERCLPEIPCGRGMDIFWNYTLYIFLSAVYRNKKLETQNIFETICYFCYQFKVTKCEPKSFKVIHWISWSISGPFTLTVNISLCTFSHEQNKNK